MQNWNLPESSEELLVGDVAISIHIVKGHESLKLNFFREESKKHEKQETQNRVNKDGTCIKANKLSAN